MRKVTLMDVYTHPVAQKYLNRSGKAHAIACAITHSNWRCRLGLIRSRCDSSLTCMIWPLKKSMTAAETD
ncbi:hypothetical protein BSAF29S_04103 [Bacillus safensis subsp. safensis]